MRCYWDVQEQRCLVADTLEQQRAARAKGEFWSAKHCYINRVWHCFYTRKAKGWKRARWAAIAREHGMRLCARCGRPVFGSENTVDWEEENPQHVGWFKQSSGKPPRDL